MDEPVIPDLQAALLCEDVRMEVNGSQTLVGVFSALIAPQVPIRLLKFCIWCRWTSGSGQFRQRARVLHPDEEKVVCENQVDFELATLDANATNVHFFTGVQFDVYGIHHAEVYLDTRLVLRYPLCVVAPPRVVPASN